MPDYLITIRNLDQAIVGSFPLSANGLASAAREIRNMLHWRPFGNLPMVGSAELVPSPMAPGWRPDSRQVALFDRTGSQIATAWITRADGRRFPAVRRCAI